MTLCGDIYYIINQNANGTFSCLQSYKDIEKAKQHAKMISSELNIACLIAKPVTKVTSSTKWIVEDLD